MPAACSTRSPFTGLRWNTSTPEDKVTLRSLAALYQLASAAVSSPPTCKEGYHVWCMKHQSPCVCDGA
jgi:hypothetical protein